MTRERDANETETEVPQNAPLRAAYDTVAQEYAARFAGELAHKPLDREMLRRFAAAVDGRGDVFDLGCGPGQTTAFLHDSGVSVCGLDLSGALLREAQRRHPGVPFVRGNMLALPCAGNALAGVAAFYAIVHFSAEALRQALTEMYRVLRPGGRLLLAFHIGEETLHVEEFLGAAVTLDFAFFLPECVAEELLRVGFTAVEWTERDPYPNIEYASRRAYVTAHKGEREAETSA